MNLLSIQNYMPVMFFTLVVLVSNSFIWFYIFKRNRKSLLSLNKIYLYILSLSLFLILPFTIVLFTTVIINSELTKVGSYIIIPITLYCIFMLKKVFNEYSV